MATEYLILYKAYKCFDNLVAHSGGIVSDAEVSPSLQVLEVQSEAAVVATRDRNELAYGPSLDPFPRRLVMQSYGQCKTKNGNIG